MTTELTKSELSSVSPAIIQNLILEGDISKMDGSQRVEYVTKLCVSLGLNALTRPFQILRLQGKEVLYATKDCTEQLRKVHGVSITDVTAAQLHDIYVVTAKAVDKTGKTDASTGAVTIGSLKGDALANALMKAETKAKRRVTLSICGLGFLDESEIETIPNASTAKIEDAQPVVVDDPPIDDRVASMLKKAPSVGPNIQEVVELTEVPADTEQAIKEAHDLPTLAKIYNECQVLHTNKHFMNLLSDRKAQL